MSVGNITRFTEATRVQMPGLVHLTRLGYTYYGKLYEDMAGTKYDPDTNILLEVFKEQFCKLNPGREGEVDETLRMIRQELDNDDLGRGFYKRLTSVSPVKLVDFDEPKNNVYHCTAEFTCKRDQDEFRPDITIFVNGFPLVFVEVKKPNNRGGMVEESTRMNRQRFPNKKFRRFINITQFMIFSNNMEYDTLGGIVPVQGAFYCAAAREFAPFNCFREENMGNEAVAPYIANFPYTDIDPDVERKILSDFNCQVIHHAPEYQTNLAVNTPTNRILTSMCSPERLLFLIKYGIAYVKLEKEVDGKIESTDQKHIMRYQQLFAAYAVRRQIKEGIKSGVIWHTQGSGKTALSYHLTQVLGDYYAQRNKVAKFYFVVDRLDLLEQATQEFEARGLEVKTANSREELMAQFRTNQAQEGNSGNAEITVVNIQRFAQDHTAVRLKEYATNLQRVFIIDEAHRGYDPKGCFLANLFDADPDSIKIALTGTPLLKNERSSWKVFGNYLHTYYYDKSIQDGYTLKIIREDIETSYKDNLSKIYEKLEHLVQKKEIQKSQIVEHDTYVKELLRYIINDLKQFRLLQGDNTLGGMVICETSEQARRLFMHFDDIQKELNQDASAKTHFKVGLILHDSDDKETRKQIIKDFKKNMTIDILIVFNMLLNLIKTLIKTGEKIDVEFKESKNDLNKDVYESVCSFNNRDGGYIILGVVDKTKEICGVNPNKVDKMKKDFTTSINNANKINPPIYLTPEDINIDDKVVIFIRVPEGTQLRRLNGRIYDRTHEGDIDITDNAEMVYKMYARKQSTYFVNKVYPKLGLEFLDFDVIRRAKKMAMSRMDNHPWSDMSEEEILRSSGLILADPETGKEGITLAAILLFGKDSTIMSVLPQYKTDAIYRVKNMDRYDDREVIITNLVDSFRRLMDFGKKHLNDVFVTEGDQSISARDKILREVVSNILAHRDYANAYTAQFVIERDKLYTKNSNLPHGHGELELNKFEPFPKNPPISKVFREIGYADELGSGMRNTNKYTKLYSGGVPKFVEENVFQIEIPISNVPELKVGPTAAEVILEKQKVNNETSFETSLKQVLKQKEYEKIESVIKKLISEKEVTIQEVMKITGKSRTTAWRYMQKLVECGVVMADGRTNNIVYRLVD